MIIQRDEIKMSFSYKAEPKERQVHMEDDRTSFYTLSWELRRSNAILIEMLR